MELIFFVTIFLKRRKYALGEVKESMRSNTNSSGYSDTAMSSLICWQPGKALKVSPLIMIPVFFKFFDLLTKVILEGLGYEKAFIDGVVRMQVRIQLQNGCGSTPSVVFRILNDKRPLIRRIQDVWQVLFIMFYQALRLN